MPSAVMGPSKEGYVWVINDAEDKMYVPEGTIMGIGQDWEEEEEQEIVEYSEPMGAVRGVGEGIPEHIKDMFDRASAGVGEDEAVALKFLLIKYRGVFAEHDMDLGDFSAVKHVIDTRDARPVKQRPRQTPFAFEGEEKKHLKILDAGIISRGVSEWASPTVLVRKRDGTVRYCIDLRKVNEVTVKDRYPLPKICECIDALAGCEYFFCLDMANGYYQIKMEGEDRDKTAFVTKYGQFVFNIILFGLSNAPGTFCRALALVLRGLSWESVVSFLDDIVILGRSFEDHMKNMEQVLSRFRDFKLKLKPSKCELLKRDIIFLGHKISREGVSPNPGKVREVKEWPTPKNKTELEAFLGLVNLYREHLDRFADTAACLYRLTGARVKFDWGEEEEDSLKKLKEAITEAPLLVYPKEGGGFVLDTDASDKAIGAVLSQVQDGKERVVAYGSFVLSTAQRNYCVTRRELLAIVVFTKHFRHYLLGNKFKVRTDHNSLIWLMRFKNIEGQLARWIEELQNYDMELLYRAGRDHGNADGMSRLPDMVKLCRGYKVGVKIEELPCGGCRFRGRMQDKWGKFEEVDDVVPLAVREVSLEPGGWVENYTKDELRKEQLEGDIVGKVLRWLELGGEPQREELLLADPAVKYFWRFKENVAIRGVVLKYKWMSGKDRWLLVVPEILKGTVLEFRHNKGMAGHMGIEKTKSRVLERAIWYNLRNSCEEHVKGCAVCNRQKKGCRVARGEQQLFHAGYALERVHIDIMGSLVETQKGNKYILVIVDQFTKWMEAFPLKNQLAETVAGVVVREFVARFGCPLEIHTDQGRNFESELFKEMCELLEIGKTRTTSYRPSA